MNDKEFLKHAKKFSEPFRVTNGKTFRLGKIDPGETLGSEDKDWAEEALESGVELIAELQDKLYAHDRWAVLLIFQAMDAAGKDGAIKHVLSGVNPQGCEVTSFKSPSAEELDHDYLWRCAKRLPERGRIGVFNRSYYEETLVVRVHKEFLEGQKLPSSILKSNDFWNQRFEAIRNFESYLTNNGIVLLKFFLHVSKEEQQKRFLSRIDDPAKNWKFSMHDVNERGHWDEYMHAYDQTVRHTASQQAPWYVVPADTKWFARLVIASAIVERMTALNLSYPKLDKAALKALASAREALLQTDGSE
jgi:PPK2 family polyphosphate:nucleotide phosphotransferase